MSKKSFKVSPTADFISAPDDVENVPNIAIQRTKETQSKRLQITLKPSLYAKLKEYADDNYMSVNGAVTTAIANLVKKGDKE